MEIERRSQLSGKIHKMDINVTTEQTQQWQDGMLIQRAMPELTPNEREFIMTGITPEEWDNYFKE